MFSQQCRAGRWTVARLFTLGVFAMAAVACGIPMTAPELTATAASGGGQMMTPVVITNPMLASSLLADAPPAVSGAPAASTPAPGPATTLTPSAPATPAASVTPGPSTTPAATTTPVAGTPRAVTPGTSTPALATAATPRATGTVVAVQAAAAGAANGDMGSQTVTLLNAYRAQAGLPALKVNAALTSSANNYARLLADRNTFGHDGPDGSSPQSRLSAAGYAGRFKGEALAAGQASPQSALNTWLNSPAHRDIVLDKSAVEVGIGYYSKPGTTYTTYWVLVTGTP